MTGRRALLAALLIYVTLDLSLASMPGAFVFEPADSFEGTRAGRGRLAADAVVPLRTVVDSVATAPPPVVTRLASQTRQCLTDRRMPLHGSLARATLDAPPPSEDAH